MIVIIITIAIILLCWYFVSNKKESLTELTTNSNQSIQQPAESRNTKEEGLNNDLNILFSNVVGKWCLRKDIIYLWGVGVQYHYGDIKSYAQDFVCGTIEREPTNPNDNNAIRFVDINGNTIAYIRKEETNNIRNLFGNDFEPRPFFGKILQNPVDQNISVLFTMTYNDNLLEEKKGVRKTIAEHIEIFSQLKFDYTRGIY